MGKDVDEVAKVSEQEANRILRTRLNNWVLERLKSWTPKPMEAKARWNIAQAVIKDINQPTYTSEEVISSAQEAINLLKDKGIVSSTPLVIENLDSLHPEEEFQTRFSRDDENGYWVAQEVNRAGEIISKACIGDKGETILTICPHGERFVNANPNIIDRKDLPRATTTTFNLLVGTISKK